jgi:hypothetical protein
MAGAAMRLAPVAIIAVALAGCGGTGSSDQAAGSKSQASSPTTPTQTPAAPKPPDPVAPLRTRLEKAGYTVQDEDVGSGTPRPEGALSVALGHGGQVTIYVYGSYTDAAKSEVSFIPVEKKNPAQIAVISKGKNVYVGTIQEPATLPLVKFRKVIATAEGG